LFLEHIKHDVLPHKKMMKTLRSIFRFSKVAQEVDELNRTEAALENQETE